MDNVSRAVRSRMMSAIHGSGTKPELFIRSALFARGYRYRVNARDLPGRPDLKLTRYRAVIMIHGCFWHGHACRYFRPPSSNVAFWQEKIFRNRARDLRDLRALREAGWRVAIVWECAVRAAMAAKDEDRLVDALAAWIEGTRPFVELYDASALAAGPSAAKTPIGRNSSVGAFAAEREPPFSTGS